MKKMTNLIYAILLVLISFNGYAAKLVFVAASNSDFAHPHDLTLSPDKRYLYVADMNNDEIKILDAETLKTLSSIGKNELDSPHDVTIDSSGRLLVADTGNNRIAIYSITHLSGKLIAELTENMAGPEGVSSDASGNIYVANAGNSQILLFNKDKFIKQAGGHGRESGRFIRAHDIEYFQEKLYIGDPGNNRIQVFSKDLNPLSLFSAPGKSFNEPKYLALDETGNLYIADQYNNKLRVFNPAGEEIFAVGNAANKSLNKLEGVEVVDDKVWVSDTYNNRIVLFQRE